MTISPSSSSPLAAIPVSTAPPPAASGAPATPPTDESGAGFDPTTSAIASGGPKATTRAAAADYGSLPFEAAEFIGRVDPALSLSSSSVTGAAAPARPATRKKPVAGPEGG